MTYRFIAEALQEYTVGLLYYLTEAGAAIADAFDGEVEAMLESICLNPLQERASTLSSRKLFVLLDGYDELNDK